MDPAANTPDPFEASLRDKTEASGVEMGLAVSCQIHFGLFCVTLRRPMAQKWIGQFVAGSILSHPA